MPVLPYTDSWDKLNSREVHFDKVLTACDSADAAGLELVRHCTALRNGVCCRTTGEQVDQAHVDKWVCLQEAQPLARTCVDAHPP
jgi:hypothetical protein